MSAAILLPLADRIQAYARQLENLATWRDRLERHLSPVEAGDAPHGRQELLQLAQARRDSGSDDDEALFFTIAWLAETWVENIFETDTELKMLSDKIRAIERREGLAEFEELDPDHPETPADWKALNAESNRRYQEVEKIRDARFIRWLLRHGETDMADLYANDRTAFDRRREAGRCSIFGPLPEISADIGEGDTGLTQVITGEG
jgi:hypothetical protein